MIVFLYNLFIQCAIRPGTGPGTSVSSPPCLICTGRYADVLVLDPFSLEILLTLSSRVQPDWITAFCDLFLLAPGASSQSQLSPATEHHLVALTRTGQVKVWTIPHADPKVRFHHLFMVLLFILLCTCTLCTYFFADYTSTLS